MANLYLTHKCKRGCSFCFARKVLKEGNIDDILTLSEIEQFIKHFPNQLQSLGLLGGEPFLYPQLYDVIQLLHQNHILVNIFTSATVPLPAKMEMIDNPIEFGLSFVVNVGNRDSYSQEQFSNLESFFQKYHTVSALSYTIFDMKADYSFLFDIIEKYQLRKNIRVGIALPIYEGGNSYIKKEDYKKAGDYFTTFAKEAWRHNIILGMDCGFVACMFSLEQMGELQLYGVAPSFSCGSALDIGPKLQVWNCFPLFQLLRVPALEYKSIVELQEDLEKKIEPALSHAQGIFPECSNCKHYSRNTCKGGCKSLKSL